MIARDGGAMNEILLYVAAQLTAIWGIAHPFATRGVVAGFGQLTPDNRRIITNCVPSSSACQRC